MKKSKLSKMSLRKETIAVLNGLSLGQVDGGTFYMEDTECGPSNPAICPRTQVTCHLFYTCP